MAANLQKTLSIHFLVRYGNLRGGRKGEVCDFVPQHLRVALYQLFALDASASSSSLSDVPKRECADF